MGRVAAQLLLDRILDRASGESSKRIHLAPELDVRGSMPRVIRVLIHCYAADDHRPQHVYLGEAAKLRLDLEGAQ